MTTSSTGGEKDLSASQTFTTSFNELVSCRSEERRSESPDPFPDLLASSRISSEGRTTNAASWVTWKFHNKVVNFGAIALHKRWLRKHNKTALVRNRSKFVVCPIGQIVIICGRNKNLASTLEAIEWKVPVKIRGFEKQMAKWMGACDCIITKWVGFTIMSYQFW
ncbi:hypothetical protein AHAS_Ahas03G0363800 [Arachis hypogaea]